MRPFAALAAAAAATFSFLAEASRLTPPILPLVVRNPYLSTWLQNARSEPWSDWPMFWAGEHQGLSVLASLPEHGTVYPLLGRPHDSLDRHDSSYNVSFAKYHGAQYDASTTNLSYSILDPVHESKSVDITLSFLSPITPSSTFRQSIPASYLTVYVSGEIDVTVYIDVNGQWVSGDRGNQIVWDIQDTPLDGEDRGLKTWKVKRAVEQMFTETRDQSEWGTLYFSGPSDVKFESGVSEDLRKGFARSGKLRNTNDNRHRGIMQEEPVFAFAKSFQANSTASGVKYQKSATFTIAHIQNPIIQYAAARGLTFMRPLWSSYVLGTEKLLAFHYQDFHVAKRLADEYSDKLAKDAFKSGAEDYVDIVALSARQVMGATHFVGTPEDPLLFMKEISSDGNTQTIDVIFPAFPFFMYTNPRWLAYLLEPLLEHMASGQYPNKYAMHDIGSSYPNATGHPEGNDEYMPVEECGNILIMGLALANTIKYGQNSSVSATWAPMLEHQSPSHKACKDKKQKIFPLTVGQDEGVLYVDDTWAGTPQSHKRAKEWVGRSYQLWNQWTSYLTEFSLEPENQLSTDDFAGKLALQTNLALKGIIGIKAMAGLAEIAGNSRHADKFNGIANDYIAKWEEYGISRDKTHAKVAYNWFGSWTTTYNLYADSLLCFHLDSKEKPTMSSFFGIRGGQKPLKPPSDAEMGFIPRHIYQLQSDWYYLVRQRYGLPLDSRHLYTKSDWEFWAMSVAAPKVRASILESVAKWLNETDTDRPMTDLYDTEEGGFPGPNFFARPVVGGHFAFLSLERACGGRAMEGLDFLNDDVTTRETFDVQMILEKEAEEGRRLEHSYKPEL